MQWSAGAHAGFSSAEPWLPVADTYRDVNVEAQKDDPGSLLSWYRSLVALRKGEPALMRGSFRMAYTDPDVLAYYREEGGDKIFAVLNFSGRQCSIGAEGASRWRVLLGTHRASGWEMDDGRVDLVPYEAVVLKRV